MSPTQNLSVDSKRKKEKNKEQNSPCRKIKFDVQSSEQSSHEQHGHCRVDGAKDVAGLLDLGHADSLRGGSRLLVR